ncbi:hypothetical protein TCAL_07346 [Tigriopus californicus]|uniref:Uncharacterized protein n=1 Tax=Tigriopus californicus TaxID=6832 RepID=A0A553NZ78_TIGCA|nr:uncharacterized protein LOC131886497 [Tigriopus californicus]TRY70749.1 hypothetical protein TCAL_07346 [Tigriopus californicus]|eukprot:TCALIF_07346-PA protein Name:"Protein of unknown function" AED:0.11 eAED:0.11 QI:248/1/0.66/1/0.5/0.33/3/0/122
MAPTNKENIILRSIFRNGTLGTYGEVVSINTTDEIPLASNFTLESILTNMTQLTLFGDKQGASDNFGNPEANPCFNSTLVKLAPTNLSDIPPKEVIIVILMLLLWLYSILLTRKAWYRLLKE